MWASAPYVSQGFINLTKMIDQSETGTGQLTAERLKREVGTWLQTYSLLNVEQLLLHRQHHMDTSDAVMTSLVPLMSRCSSPSRCH